MLTVPTFEPTILVTDDAALAARVSSLFVRPGRYLSVMDGPRMGRQDATNEVARRSYAMSRTSARHVLMGGITPAAAQSMRAVWRTSTLSDAFEDHVQALKGVVKRPEKALEWGPDNLGVGLYRARLARQELQLTLGRSSADCLVEAGRHLLVICEIGDALAEVTASNLAFAAGASFATFPGLSEDEVEDWVEEIYALGDGVDPTGRLSRLADRARQQMGSIDFSRYKAVLFVTGGFPWGIAVSEVPTTHMYRYPDFGRSVIEGLWASQSDSRSARTALLIDPQTVEGSEISTIRHALLKNGTLTKLVSGPAATQVHVQFLLDAMPNDIIVVSSHAGDASGSRITYEYPDAEGCTRRLTIDRALGIGYDSHDDMYAVMQYYRFHNLDGVDWRDREGKRALPVGTAITSWLAIDGAADRSQYVVAKEEIPRVVGSMAMKLHDGNWLYISHGFPPESAPLFVNNACWSWHQLSQRTTFAGARGYLGSLFPITDAEAQEVAQNVFGRYLGRELVHAIWLAQREVYGASRRRPYVLVGLPFISIKPNHTDAVGFLDRALVSGITDWSKKAKESPYADVRRNAEPYARFLHEELNKLRSRLIRRRHPDR